MQSLSGWRSALGLMLTLGALSPIALFASRTPPATSDPILEIHADGLTTYRYSGNTLIQDIRPMVGQRGTNLDGSERASPSQRMAIAGNPFEATWRSQRVGDVRLDLGTYQGHEVDIALPAEGFSWVIGRSYNARQEDSGGMHRNSSAYQGINWMQDSQPELRFHNPSGDSNDKLYLVYGADRFAEYRRDTGSMFEVYRGTNGAAGIIEKIDQSSPEPDLYILHDQHGNKLTFFTFGTDSGVAKGQLWTIVDAAGNKAYVGHATTGSSAITSGFNASGYITLAYDSSGRKYTYTYSSFDSVTRLSQVKVEKNTGSWVTVATVDYDYYLTGQSHGTSGDLKKVTVTTPLTESGANLVQKKYYRYWTGTYDPGADPPNPGYPHALKYVVDFEGTRRRDWEDSTFDEDFLSDTDDVLKEYASAYFEYDSNHQIKKTWSAGQCGCGTGNQNGTFELTYESNGSFSGTSGYDTTWKTRTIVKRPDLTYLTVYWDEVHQPLSQVITNQDPSITSPAPEKWVTAVTRDSNGMVTSIASPANCTGYTHSTGSISSSTTVGLVNDFTRQSSGAAKSFLTARHFKEGQTGTAYYEAEWEWTSVNKSVQDEHIIRPFLDKKHEYQVQGTTTANRITTDYTPTAHTSSIALQKNPVTDPAISTGKNGSGTANDAGSFYRTDATMSFEEDRDGVITYSEFTDGLLTKLIEDADTGTTSDFDVSVPSGLASESGAIRRITTYSYDNQGRLDETTYPDGRRVKRYYTKLVDGRLVTLEYNDYATSPSTKYYGPVKYTVQNQAGNVEVSAVVGLTGDESTVSLASHVDESVSGFIEAMDLGTIERLQTTVHNKSGHQVRERRAYFTVPSSGEGDATSNYDPTVIAYDDMGRVLQVTAPHGTIQKRTYDTLGRVYRSWIGTDDGSPGNMVKVEELEFDGNADDGNSYVTKHTRFVQDSTSDQRVTTYTNDARGRMLLETRPTAPHLFHKYDNQGRRLATGSYSTTSSISPLSDDPTTETGGRVALMESTYDELGRMWKSARHNIDAGDGSDDDSLSHLYWRDEDGRVIKEDGPELVKYAYHRLGWQTHKFTLAEDNDTAYADADDVTGDYVVEEDQSGYDNNTGKVWLRVNIQRYHDDWGGGSTTGALDTNADSDPLKVTAANLKGRAQITGYWYDRFWRVVDQVRYGTNGGSDLNRGTTSAPPARSDNELRTSYAYGKHGDVEATTDPRALVRRTSYNAAGRVTTEIRNYGDGTPDGTDSDQTTIYSFTDGLLTQMRVDVPGSGDQDTDYTYGTVKGTSAGESRIATGHLLQKVKYPDSAISDDVVRMAYNAQGQIIWRQDQRHSTSDTANVVQFDYDAMGRLEQDRVTTEGTGFNELEVRIARTYDSLGRPELVTQYDSPTVGNGTALDEVKYTYDGWGNVTKFEQDLNSAVGAGTPDDYEFTSTYDDFTTGRNTLRRTSMTLPGGRAITLDYSLNKDASLSRVSKLVDGGTTLVTYDYLGVGFEVEATYPQPGIYGTVCGSTSGSYPRLDRFNRITRSTWTSDVSIDVDFYDCKVSYDRNSNITWVEDEVHSGFDVKYTMDNLDRLVDAEEGTKSGSSIASLKRRQQWTSLSHTGNWDRANLDLDGDGFFTGTDEYDETRTHNAVNELTAQNVDSSGGDDYTLTHDAVGNLTDDGKDYKYEYDAFRRLRRIKNRGTDALVAEYRYNGLGYLIEIHEDTDADGDVDDNDPWFHPLYDEGWRMVGTARSEMDGSRGYDQYPKEDYVLQIAGLDGRGGSSYINGVVCRNRDAGANGADWAAQSDGTLEERYYYCQNWRGDVSALVSSGRKLHEWGKFSPYGVPNGLPGADTDSDGDCDANDVNQIATWRTSGPPAQYDVRGDVDLDHDVDLNDENLASAITDTLGWRLLSRAGIRNSVGYAAYKHAGFSHGFTHVRKRSYSEDRGVWQQRDPAGYLDLGANLYAYVAQQAVAAVDPYGLFAAFSGGDASEVLELGDDCPGCGVSGTGGTPVGPNEAGNPQLYHKLTGGVLFTIEALITIELKAGECVVQHFFPCTNMCSQARPCSANISIRASLAGHLAGGQADNRLQRASWNWFNGQMFADVFADGEFPGVDPTHTLNPLPNSQGYDSVSVSIPCGEKLYINIGFMGKMGFRGGGSVPAPSLNSVTFTVECAACAGL